MWRQCQIDLSTFVHLWVPSGPVRLDGAPVSEHVAISKILWAEPLKSPILFGNHFRTKSASSGRKAYKNAYSAALVTKIGQPIVAGVSAYGEHTVNTTCLRRSTDTLLSKFCSIWAPIGCHFGTHVGSSSCKRAQKCDTEGGL